MPTYYVLVMPTGQEPFAPDPNKVLRYDLCGQLWSRSYKRAIQEAAEYREQVNGGWDFDVLGPKTLIVVASSKYTARPLKGFAQFKDRRVTDSKWDKRKK